MDIKYNNNISIYYFKLFVIVETIESYIHLYFAYVHEFSLL